MECEKFLVGTVMCLYEGAKTRVRVVSVRSWKIEVKDETHQVSALSSFLQLW